MTARPGPRGKKPAVRARSMGSGVVGAAVAAVNQAERSRLRRVLFVCGGNTCRSPMAEGILNARYGDVALARSAGINADGGGASPHAVETIEKLYGIGISAHRARGLDQFDLSAFDVIVAMDETVSASLPDARPGQSVESWRIADPFGKDGKAYEAAARAIARKVDALMVRHGGSNDGARAQATR